jgi:NTE family protein
MRDVSVADAMGASSAVPAVFAPMRLPEAGCLVDGGVANILPVDLLLAYGERNVVAIDIGEPYSPPMCQSLFEIASHSLSVMSDHLKECTTRGERLLIRPKLPDEAGLFTFDLMEECLEAGYRAARELIDVIRALA